GRSGMTSCLEDLTLLRHEYGILKKLKVKDIAKPVALLRHADSLALVLEGFDGDPLSVTLTDCGRLELSEFLRIAIKLAKVIGEMHLQGVIHKDIKPANIFYNPTTGDIKLYNFALASLLPSESYDEGRQLQNNMDADTVAPQSSRSSDTATTGAIGSLAYM